MEWNYGNAFERYPCENGIIEFENGSKLKCHDIFKELPDYMKCADMIFVDPPWNKGNINTFYRKAEIDEYIDDFSKFYIRLFQCIKEIKPDVCYVEIGKEYLADYIIEMRKIFKYVTFYNSTYYHNKKNLCYVLRGSKKYKKPKLDGMDEEDIIEYVCENENYTAVSDLCMGRGLVAVNATKNGKLFYGTELNHKRLAVTIERVIAEGLKIKENNDVDINKGMG